MLPKIYTPQEVAQILKLNADEVIQTLETGQIKGFKVAGQWRISESSLLTLIASAQPMAKQDHATVSLKHSEPFYYNWPTEAEQYNDAYEGEVSLDGHTIHVKVGWCNRDSYGRERRRAVVFLDGYPVTEFVETDVPDIHASLVPGADNPRGNLRPGQSVPTQFTNFDIKPMRDVIQGPGVYNAQAVVVRANDFETMVRFGILKARHRGRI